MDTPDFERIFNAIPANYVAYDLDWNIVAITESSLAAVGRAREDVIGRNQFDAFPDNPDDPDATGNATMLGAFRRVLEERKGHVLPITRYDIADADGVFQKRYWQPLNEPVFDSAGQIQYVIHGVQDVTTAVHETNGEQ
jgi:PAS domain-containing protein